MTTIMENLIEEANRLQLVASKVNETLNWDLPEIYVVGAQSSGKSSVLDRIVGRQILPKGDGMVTKTPIRLELNPIPDIRQNGAPREYVVFGHRPDEKFTNFNEVSNEIMKRMNYLVEMENKSRIENLNDSDDEIGTRFKKEVSKTPVLVKFFSPKVLKLTLVDMPGLIRVRKVPGDNLPDEIDELVRSYINKPNSLIVAIAVGDDDAENSAGYAEAQRADPEGRRTLVVVTKVDRAPNIEKTKRLLLGQEAIKPHLGIVGVINTSPATDNDASFQIKKDAELAYFKDKFEPYLDGKYGVEYLSVKLQEVLYKHIKEALPLVLPKIYPKMESLRKQLDWLGDEVDPASINDKDDLLTKLIEKYSIEIKKMMDGEPQIIPVQESTGGAKIDFIIFNDLPLQLRASATSVLDTLTLSDLDKVIRSTEARPHAFTSHKVLEFYLNKVIDALMEPSKLCLNSVYFEIKNVVEKFKNDFAEDGFFCYPFLVESLVEETGKLIDELVAKTKDQVELHIARERALKNYSHPDYDIYVEYYKNKAVVQNPNQQSTAVQQQPPSLAMFLSFDKTLINNTNTNTGPAITLPYLDSKRNRDFRKFDRNYAAAVILGYSEIIAKSYADVVPKIIYHQLLDEFNQRLFFRLQSVLRNEIENRKLFYENENVTQKRKDLRSSLHELEEVERFLHHSKFGA